PYTTLFRSDAETEVLHDSVLPDERMHLMGGDLALAGDETGIADSMRDAAAAAERPEVRHDAVVPQERTRLGSAVAARPDNPSRFVDPIGHGRRVTRQDSAVRARDRGRCMRRRHKRKHHEDQQSNYEGSSHPEHDAGPRSVLDYV